MNPVALALWAFCCGVGFLIAGVYGAVVGVTVGIGISLLATMLD